MKSISKATSVLKCSLVLITFCLIWLEATPALGARPKIDILKTNPSREAPI